MNALQRLKRDLSKHPAKAAVLGGLFVVMVVMSVKAVFELRPAKVGAAAMPVQVASPATAGEPAVNAGQADARIKESGMLWEKLRELKTTGAPAAETFTFDASFYPTPAPDPAELARRMTPAAIPVEIAPPSPVQARPTVDPEVARVGRVREQARGLIVKSTALGNGTTQPVAIINQQLLTVGQDILGFEIVAIRAREVEFKKDGIVVPVKMLDEPRGQ